jgi:RimJ/RimL family protein N-acetyltransferase
VTDASHEPVIVTERLELWRPRAGDIEPMFAIASDPATGRHLAAHRGFADHFERFCRNAGSWLLYGYGAFMVRRRGAAELIGNCGIFRTWRGLGEDFDGSAEAGWVLRADCTGQGLASEAMQAVFEWFEATHGKQRVVCMTAPDNTASLALAAKLGFTPIRDAVLPDGDPVTLLERLPAAAIRS